MTIVHAQHMLAELSVGAEHVPDLALEHFGISTSAVVSIPSCYSFWPEDSCCPVSNVRGSGVGIQFYDDGELEVRGGSWCLFCFKLGLIEKDRLACELNGEYGPANEELLEGYDV